MKGRSRVISVNNHIPCLNGDVQFNIICIEKLASPLISWGHCDNKEDSIEKQDSTEIHLQSKGG